MSEIIAMWLNKRCGSENSKYAYKYDLERFLEHVQMTPESIVNTWQQVRYDLRLKQEFADDWTQLIEGYVYGRNDSMAPKSKARMLAAISSFFHSLKIPVEPEQVARTFVKYHNRDITKAEIRTLLENANLRDKCFFLIMVESGQRPNTLAQLQYKHIKMDFESGRIPMAIDLPSEILKDNVEARWTFLGEDGYNVLKEYLTPRMPMKDDEYLFGREKVRKEAKKGVPLKRARKPYAPGGAFSMKFNTIATKLGWTTKGTDHGVKHQLRLYCLRKYFNNAIKADRAYVEYWMGHTATQQYYVAKDIERHREEYAKGYDNLRIYLPDKQLTDLDQRLKEKETQLSLLTARIQKLEPLLKLVEMIGIEDEQTMAKFVEEIKKAKTAAITLGE